MSVGGDLAGRGAEVRAHDRIDAAVYTSQDAPEKEEMEPDVPLGQKMLSAVSGSILTSLLGMSWNCYTGVAITS